MLSSKASWELEWQLIFLLCFSMFKWQCRNMGFSHTFSEHLGQCSGEHKAKTVTFPDMVLFLSLWQDCWQMPAVISASWEMSAVVVSTAWQKLLMFKLLPLTESCLADSVCHMKLNLCQTCLKINTSSISFAVLCLAVLLCVFFFKVIRFQRGNIPQSTMNTQSHYELMASLSFWPPLPWQLCFYSLPIFFALGIKVLNYSRAIKILFLSVQCGKSIKQS